MSDFKSTIYGYHRYLDNGLFPNLTVPEGINKDVLIDVILSRCGEMCPVWTDPEFMVEMIGVWSTKYEKTFEKWYAAYTATYNPIHNYDRTELLEGWDHAENIGTDDTTVTNNRSAYNATAMQPHDESTVDGDTTSNHDSSYSHTNHMSGNIGVTTTQQMLEAEYSIAEWNIYENIADLFLQEFCIMIY